MRNFSKHGSSILMVLVLVFSLSAQQPAEISVVANKPVTDVQPINLKFIGIGNEQWEEQYIERYREFEKVLKSRYTEIKIVSGAGPSASGRYFDYAWSELKKLNPALIDEHYYMPAEWFLKNAGRYDNYDREGIKVFAGEYAAHWKGQPVCQCNSR
jgi:alpha-L-arabinofuranosidase